ncbi:hypothetical protein MK805_10600 [Shimazuella sp. AN120528]|uniref:hypothetical protein n=1 Tax=Shimazuella soli TaxID=1892854 RepID=UPI001F11146E|nr:hypothetical protein [Shimazuella soli]MCH5585400.1 hypothetical protein [Shimazuella soli]
MRFNIHAIAHGIARIIAALLVLFGALFLFSPKKAGAVRKEVLPLYSWSKDQLLSIANSSELRHWLIYLVFFYSIVLVLYGIIGIIYVAYRVHTARRNRISRGAIIEAQPVTVVETQPRLDVEIQFHMVVVVERVIVVVERMVIVIERMVIVVNPTVIRPSGQ